LIATLDTAPLPFLEGALVNPALLAKHVLLLLRNPSITPDLIARLARSPVWMKPYDVKAALVSHPKAPRRGGHEFHRTAPVARPGAGGREAGARSSPEAAAEISSPAGCWR